MWQLAIPIIGNVLDKIFPDKGKADEAKAKLLELQMNGEIQQLLGQMEINKAEASSGDPFTSRWRPSIGYICAAALAWHYILNPVVTWSCAIWAPEINPPSLPIDDHLWELTAAMLGLGLWRTVDKVKGGAK